MKISMIGAGYVGLVTGTCLSNLGNDVICMDIDKSKVDGLNKGIIPIYEPGLRDLVEMNAREGRLRFTTDMAEAIKNSDAIFIAVGTPSAENGVADLSYVFAAAKSIAQHMTTYKVIVVKSTVPPGTCDQIKQVISDSLKSKLAFDVVSNPEFLREGEAINDFMFPDRIVVGVDNDAARKIMVDIYKPIERTGRPLIITDIRSSELIKYVSNAMLAARISFMNEMSHLCDEIGADVKTVARGVGLDNRVGPRFLQAGAGYGGSCFPKDVKALASIMKENDITPHMLLAIDKVNEEQKKQVLAKVKHLLGELKGKKIALWGLSFKPKTDDMREASSIVFINEAHKLGAKIVAFDPVAKENAKKIIGDKIEYANNAYEAVKGAHCLVLMTEWDEFRELDKARVKELMEAPNLIDARNIYDPSEMAAYGFNYLGMGRR